MRVRDFVIFIGLYGSYGVCFCVDEEISLEECSLLGECLVYRIGILVFC